jgi:hypothetical protein
MVSARTDRSGPMWVRRVWFALSQTGSSRSGTAASAAIIARRIKSRFFCPVPHIGISQLVIDLAVTRHAVSKWRARHPDGSAHPFPKPTSPSTAPPDGSRHDWTRSSSGDKGCPDRDGAKDPRSGPFLSRTFGRSAHRQTCGVEVAAARRPRSASYSGRWGSRQPLRRRANHARSSME